MRKFWSAFLLCHFLLGNLIAQSDSVNVPIVKYDFNTSTFDKPFPFDQSFLIGLVNVPEGFQSLGINIREVKGLRKIVKDLTGCAGGTDITNQAIFDKLKVNYHYSLRMDQFYGDTVFLQLGYLCPNTDYIFEVVPPGTRKLSDLERKKLVEYLLKLPITDNIVNKLVEATLVQNLESLSFLSGDLASINTAFQNAIKAYESQYDFAQLTGSEVQNKFDAEILNLLAQFVTKFKNLEGEINEFYNDAMRSDSSISGYRFSNDAANIDWSKLETGLGSKEYRDYIEKLKVLETSAGLTDYLEDARIIEQFDKLISKNLLPLREIAKVYVARTVAKHVSMATSVASTYYRGATANARTYLSLDLGVGINTRFKEHFSYTGINIYLSPINTAIPLKKYGFFPSIPKRFSFLAGISLTSVEAEKQRKGVFGNKAAIVGAGFRVLPWLKFNYAQMIYYERVSNPLVNKKFLTTDPFLSVSIDANLASIFNSLFRSNP